MIIHSPRLERHLPAAFAAALMLALLPPSFGAVDSPSSPFPGLELVASKNVGTLYRRPDVDITAYNKIMIGEPVVEFSKNWNPKNYGRFGLSAAELTKIRVDLAAMAKGVFAKALSDGGYQIVTEAGDSVLVITPNVINVFINAPDTSTYARERIYAMDGGSATLALQINDAVTGTLLAVALDQQKSGSSRMQWVSSGSNQAAADAMLAGWARQLKRELNAARAK